MWCVARVTCLVLVRFHTMDGKNGCAIYRPTFTHIETVAKAFTAPPYRRCMHRKKPYMILRPANDCSTITCLLRMKTDTRKWQPGTLLTFVSTVYSTSWLLPLWCHASWLLRNPRWYINRWRRVKCWLRKPFIKCNYVASIIQWTNN